MKPAARGGGLGVVGAVLLLGSCASPERGARVLEVPFMAQPPDRCGPAAVAMVARHHGVEPDLEALERDIHIPALSGSIPALLAEGARKQGLAAEVRSCGEPELLELMGEGIPPILMLAPAGGEPRGHFVVVTGLNPRTGALRVHSGESRDRWLAPEDWRERWRRAGGVAVVIRPN